MQTPEAPGLPAASHGRTSVLLHWARAALPSGDGFDK